ncbi:zinc finger protein [Teratosphaeria destructans]|uniref:Zinc finger protein n=1 Tax=Teratosphaeria destructans TaxID=418781 RepID=A0A9W7SX23_9PEZI|nr:zinc finger protein [Teratosphaeria destructans]
MPPRPRADSVKIDPFEGHSNITRAPLPPRKYALEELIDPNDIPENGHCRSPSGDILSKHEFLKREDRPISIRER